MQVLSIQVGRPRQIVDGQGETARERTWSSGFFKEPVTGRVRVGVTNVDGDGQADLKNHGGPDKAVLGYAAAHYPAWWAELGRVDLPYGAFGENLTVAGMDESTVCIGDVYEVGEARLQVSQPRWPCWKISRRWQIPDLSNRVLESGRSGWYMRVLLEGWVEAGQAIRLLERLNPDWTVARAYDVMARYKEDRATAALLAAVPGLSDSWRETLSRASQ